MEGWLIAVFSLLVLFLLVIPSLYHWLRSLYELKAYLSIKKIKERHEDIYHLDTKRGRIVYRYTKAYSLGGGEEGGERASLISNDYGGEKENRQEYPVVLPGGLGSTLTTTSFIHARLVQAGFDVLSYDRLGVGLSTWPKKPSGPQDTLKEMEETIEEMEAVMSHANADAKGWIVIGGSYGSTVGQLYTATYPEKVVGFINWDGLPYYLSQFPKTRKSFSFVSVIYTIEAIFSDLGFFRFPIWLLLSILHLSRSYALSGFKWEEVYAEFQDSKLLRTIAMETPRMMDCCDLLVNAWGDINFHHLSPNFYAELIDCPPDVIIRHPSNGDVSQQMITHEEMQKKEELKRRVRDLETSSKLAQRWRDLPVVSLSCRNYDYDKMELFMTKENKDLYAAEHVFLALLAREGLRIVFPDKSHLGSVTLGDYLVKYALHISHLASDIHRGIL